MKKNDFVTHHLHGLHGVFGCPEYRALRDVQVFEQKQPEQKEVVMNEGDDIFSIIFSVNPKTKLPDGDIVQFMSEKTSPEIRDYIQRQLMNPIDLPSDGGKYDGLDDDTIAAYTRHSYESVTEYRDRMYSVVRQQSLDRQASKQFAKQQDNGVD